MNGGMVGMLLGVAGLLLLAAAGAAAIGRARARAGLELLLGPRPRHRERPLVLRVGPWAAFTHGLVVAGYWIRPFDVHRDARRWRWQRSGRQRVHAALAALPADERSALDDTVRRLLAAQDGGACRVGECVDEVADRHVQDGGPR